MAAQKFAADRMLGRLATWLRLIGQDAAYGAHLGGRELLRRARAEGRIVLTRDTRLRAGPGVELFFVHTDRFRDQLCEVISAYAIDPYAALLTRCSRCNHALDRLRRVDAEPRVPPYVARTAERFVRCPACRRIYWPGTHEARIRAELRALALSDPAGSPSRSPSSD